MRTLASGILVLVLAGSCSREQPPARLDAPAPEATRPPLSGLPVEMTVQQRTTTPVPGSDGRLRLTIDDITRNQVMVSLSDEKGGSVMAPVSLAPIGTAAFSFGGVPYELTLSSLRNALIGQDRATFRVSGPKGSALSEDRKIEMLIDALTGIEGAIFIRNGTEHTAKEAGEHLRTKWRAGKDSISTATRFIDDLGSRSSLSGEPYRIRLPDERVVLAGDWLRERLAEIEAAAR